MATNHARTLLIFASDVLCLSGAEFHVVPSENRMQKHIGLIQCHQALVNHVATRSAKGSANILESGLFKFEYATLFSPVILCRWERRIVCLSGRSICLSLPSVRLSVCVSVWSIGLYLVPAPGLRGFLKVKGVFKMLRGFIKCVKGVFKVNKEVFKVLTD